MEGIPNGPIGEPVNRPSDGEAMFMESNEAGIIVGAGDEARFLTHDEVIELGGGSWDVGQMLAAQEIYGASAERPAAVGKDLLRDFRYT